MTNRRVGRTNRRDPRPWRVGKLEKPSTNRFLRRWRSSRMRRYFERDG